MSETMKRLLSLIALAILSWTQQSNGTPPPVNTVNEPVKMSISITKPSSPEVPESINLEAALESAKSRLSEVETKMGALQQKFDAAIAPENTRQQLEISLKQDLASTGAVVYRDNEFVVVRVPEAAFNSGSNNAPSKVKQILEPIAKASLKNVSEFDLMVEGHSDSRPVRKGAKFENNWQVGYARAETVAELLQKMTLRTDSIAIATRASNLPITPSGADAENRRVEFVFMPKRSLPKDAQQTAQQLSVTADKKGEVPKPVVASTRQQKPQPPSPKKQEATSIPTSLDPEGDEMFRAQAQNAPVGTDIGVQVTPMSAEEFQEAIKSGALP